MASLLSGLCLLFIMSQSAATSQRVSLPGCPSSCGNLTIPYPFGLGTSCSRKGFDLTCNHSFSPPRTFLRTTNMEVSNISLIPAVATALHYRASDCYSENGSNNGSNTPRSWVGNELPYTFSSTRNKFAVLGCDTYAYIYGYSETGLSGGCVTTCNRLDQVTNGSCDGIGCCQVSIPKGLKYYRIRVKSFNNYTEVWDFNPCGYAFLVDKDWFTFQSADISKESLYRHEVEKVPLVMDWVAGNESCAVAERDRPTFACRSNNSHCYNSNSSATGYLCNCSSGYEGNPYLDDGCQDIDECQNLQTYPCRGDCTNTQGSYNCSCASGFHSDDPKTQSCIRDPTSQKLTLASKLAIGLGCSLIFLAIVCCSVYWGSQKRKLIQLKQKFFKQNGGLFLQQQIRSDHQTTFRLFSKEELAKATNNFSEDRILGKGGHGIVYKGVLDDNRTVAVKRSTILDEHNSKEFAREMFILSKINHKNVVKILGCCLEVEVPMLVYEFVANGTLFHHIHEKKSDFLNSFDTRLRIAKEAADALAYLHSAASPPILHGDIKPSNILLDESYTAKVSDFGTAILAPSDKEQFTTLVQGTCGYLDPEYMQTCQLTEKSDVYSFGVLLVELLTGRKALYFGGSKEIESTALTFLSYMNDSRLFDILDTKIIKEEWHNQVQKVARIAKACLSLKGEERPTMREVMIELESLQKPVEHPWGEISLKDTENLLVERPETHLLKDSSDFQSYNSSTTFSLEQGFVKNVHSGR